jgi:hypothetical protein
MRYQLTIYFMGWGHKPRFKANNKMPHHRMDKRNEFNIHLFGYRVAITWGYYTKMGV